MAKLDRSERHRPPPCAILTRLLQPHQSQRSNWQPSDQSRQPPRRGRDRRGHGYDEDGDEDEEIGGRRQLALPSLPQGASRWKTWLLWVWPWGKRYYFALSLVRFRLRSWTRDWVRRVILPIPTQPRCI